MSIAALKKEKHTVQLSVVSWCASLSVLAQGRRLEPI